MPERRQNLARMNRARLHTLSPELTAARKKKILLSSVSKSLFDTLWQFFKLLKSLKNWLIERERHP